MDCWVDVKSRVGWVGELLDVEWTKAGSRKRVGE